MNFSRPGAHRLTIVKAAGASMTEDSDTRSFSNARAAVNLPGRYEIHDILKTRASCTIVRTTDHILDREVLIKIFAVADGIDETQRQRFLLEARALASLNSDNNSAPAFQMTKSSIMSWKCLTVSRFLQSLSAQRLLHRRASV
jgi:hypothetical protein